MSRVSVVVTTYNGRKYIFEQLDSIRDQSRPADEVLILDDKSSDGTFEAVQEYIRKNHLWEWKIIANQTNIGWKRNFKKGFDLCGGDYVFPCDQDDVWHLDKIERMVQAMEEKSEILLLTSNYNVFTSDDARVEPAYQHDQKLQRNDGSVEKAPFDAQWCYIKKPGCAYCFRRSFYDAIKDTWNTAYAHDAQLYRWAHLKGGLYLFNARLFEYRRHGDNATSIVDRGRAMRLKDIQYYLDIHESALEWVHTMDDNDRANEAILERNIRFLKMRLECLKKRKVYLWPILVVKYKDCYRSWKGILLDLRCSLAK